MGILDFFSREAGQQRRASLDEFGRDLGYYVPPELRSRLGLLASMNPVEGVSRSMQASERMTAPGRTPMQRVGDAGEMLSEVAGVVAPVAVAGRAGIPAAQALQETLLGFSAPRSASEAMARDILDLRAAGRADEVTEEMMAAADDTYMYFNTPLPMDEASRSARARTIGHNVDREFYRGGGTDRQALSADAGQFATQGTGVFMDPNPMRAETYGKMVAPLLTRSDAPIVSGDMSMFNRIEAPVYAWDRANDVDLPLIPGSGSTSTDDIARSARGQGLEALEIQDITDPGPRRWRNEDGSIREYPQFGTTRVEFDPANIRSRFARFDPAFAHLRNLSAGIGGLGLLGLASGNQPAQGDGT